VTLTISEAAAALGISNDTFRRFVLPDLRVVQASPRLMLVRVAELERWATRREALAELD
jgi:excisionase family DNA binding protein